MAPDDPVGPGVLAGHARDWAAFCRQAASLPASDEAVRSFFEAKLTPWRLSDGAGSDRAFLTGYFQPEVAGARAKRPGYPVPLYRLPPDPAASAYSRAEVDAGALAGRRLELVWLADPIDAFFVSIQGSAEVALAEGGVMAIGVAGSNGRSYVAIGRGLVARGEIPADKISLQTIRAWLRAHPAEARGVMESNPRYIFFREIPGGGPIGSAGVPLTAGRSLAVDPAFMPMNVPIYIDSSDAMGRPLRRLTLAQDSGSAIKGPLRADFYWGAGAAAEAEAGAMQSPGRLFMLLPRGMIPAAGSIGR